MRLSIVIPAYNEAGRIGGTLESIEAYLTRRTYKSEVIVVDDGSTDETATIVRERFPEVRLISYRPNRGKGHAVRTGMTHAHGDYRVFYDADASTPIEEVEKLWPHFDAGADIVIGSRALPESNVQVHQAWYRENMGRIFNVLIRMLGLTHYPDTQCGFKGFTARACAVVFPRQTIERFSFDAELLYIAAKHGLRIEQTGVCWINCPYTRLNPIADSTRMFLDVLTIRWKDLCGRYR
ncbi:MAG: glycosyltransferase family 2 protein [Candidatus Hydrogenedentes bacterium]|nr:glycosyltransferase family 2 protein [Candidatus Hydrogenedentota bacterium]